MKQFKYAVRINLLLILSWIVIFAIAYFIYSFSIKDIDYIIMKHGKVYVSQETSTLFYGSGAVLVFCGLVWTMFEAFKSKINPNSIKVNEKGVFLPIKINSKKNIMINYSEISNIATNKKKVTINYKLGKVCLFKRYFDDEYKFNNFSNIIYSNLHSSKQNA